MRLGLLSAGALAVPFGYETHGADWAEGSCNSRTAQSPVSLSDVYGPPSGTFEVNYGDPLSAFDVANDGEVLAARVPPGRGVVLRGQAYDLMEVQFHAPAEHTLGAHRPALEVQLRHVKPGSARRVHVSLLFDPPPLGLVQLDPRLASEDPAREEQELAAAAEDGSGAALSRLETEAEVRDVDALTAASALVRLSEPPANATPPYIPPLPSDPGYAPGLAGVLEQELPLPQAEVAVNGSGWDLQALVAGGEFIGYAGSLTTPPCSEGVEWLVGRAPARASADQLARFRKALADFGPDGNWRVLMPFNRRPVEVLRAVPRASPVQPVTEPVADDREFIAKRNAEDAVTIAQHMRSYARDVDQELRTSTIAHLKAFMAPNPTPAPTPLPPPPPPSPGKWLEPKEQARGLTSAAMNAVVAAARRMTTEAAAGLEAAHNVSAFAAAAGLTPPAP